MPALLLGLLPMLGGVLDRFLPDPEAKAKAMQEIMEMGAKMDIAQLEVNKAEAASSSMFVAGWRPAIGWVCAFALFYTYLLLPLGLFVAGFFGEKFVTMFLNAPSLDANLWELMFAMLGMAGLRSFDKLKGIAK